MNPPHVPNAQERKWILEKLRRKASASNTVPPEAEPKEGSALSPAQNSMWVAWKLAPQSSAYHCSINLRFIGRLQIPALESALNSILQRHENLRACFPEEGSQPQQHCHPWSHVPLPVHDLTADQGRRKEPVQAQIARASKPLHAPFALDTGPLIRWLLIRHEPENHTLHVVVHHIVFDAWSRQIFIRELAHFYNHQQAHPGLAAPLEPFPLQGRTWNRRLREWIGSAAHQRSLDYWKQTLTPAPPLLSLPFDHPRNTGGKEKSSHQDLLLPADLVRQVEKLAQDTESTVFMVLLSILRIVLHRYTGQTDQVIGVAVAGRNQPDAETLMGCLINSIPVRQTLNPSLSLREHLLESRNTLLDALNHSRVDFSTILESTHPVRHPAHHPLFQVLLNYRSEPKDNSTWHELEVLQEDVIWNSTVFDLSFDLDPIPGGLRLRCLFHTHIVSETDVQRLMQSFRAVLQHTLNSPETICSRIAVISEQDRQKLICCEGGAGVGNDRKFESLFHRLEHIAAQHADHAAVQSPEGTFSYSQLFALTREVADQLSREGIRPGDVVAVAIPHSPEFMATTLALLRCGATFVPLDPAYPVERLRFMLEDSQAVCLVAQGDIGTDWCGKVRRLTLEPFAPDSASPRDIETAHWPAEEPEEPAYIIYTSGSTGEPNGVVVSRRAFAQHLKDCIELYQFESKDRVLSFAALSFDAALEQTFAPLAAGATIVFRPRELLSPHDFSRFLSRNQVTVADLPPSLWMPLTQVWAGPKLPHEAKSLRLIIVGGEEMPLAGAELWMKSALKSIRLINAYGPTETVITSTTCDVTRQWSANDPWRRVPIGSFLGDRWGYILDPHHQLLPPGVPGELYIGGSLLALGYLHRPALTQDRFCPDPFSPRSGARMYRTGDLCRWRHDGQLEFLGRLDQQVKLRGFRIELGEIESAILQNPGVNQACAMLVGSGDRGARIVAALVEKPGFHVDRKTLVEQVQSKLPSFMVPSQYLWLEKLPTLPNGKLDKATLTRAAEQPQDETASSSDSAPLEGAELRMAEIWKELLGREVTRKHDNFFELGGDSLIGMRLMVRIAELFHAQPPISELFESRDLADFTIRVQSYTPNTHSGGEVAHPHASHKELPASRSENPAEFSSGTQLRFLERAPLSPSQEQLYILHQLQPGSTWYQILDAWRIRGRLDLKALEWALHAVVKRHPVLRTCWTDTGSTLEQVILPEDRFAVQITRIEGVPLAEGEARAREIMEKEQATPFDPHQGPLFRAHVVILTEELHQLILTTHHAVTDGWSEPILLKELSEAYAAAVESRIPRWTELPDSYLNYAMRQQQRRWQDDQPDMDYWACVLKHPPADCHPPLDHPRKHRTSFRGHEIALRVGDGAVKQMQVLARTHSMSPFMVCTSAIRLWLMHYTGLEDVILGSASSGRQDTRTHGLVGFFVNMLALRMQIPWSARAEELLKDTRRVILEAFDHSQAPFETLVHHLQPPRTKGANPFFQIVVLHEKTAHSDLHLPDLQSETISLPTTTSKFDLTFLFREDAHNLTLHVEYSSELFKAETVQRMASHAIQILEQIVFCPELPLSEISPFSREERSRILVEWNTTGTDYPSSKTIETLFSEQAGRTPHALAVITEQRSWTYGDLERESSRLAKALQDAGVEPRTLVSLCMDRSWELIVSVLAVLKTGAAYLPLSPDAPPEWQKEMILDSGTRWLLTQGSLAQDWGMEGLQRLVVNDLLAQVEPDAQPHRRTDMGAAELAYVMYTSGSTGRPKGVMIPHRGVVRLVQNTRYADFSDQQTFLLLAPISFDASTLEIWGPLLNGGRLALAPPGRTTLEDMARAIRQHSVTTLWLTSGLFNIVVDEKLEMLQGLKQLLIGGDVLSVSHVRRAHEFLRGCTLINGYGPTENTTFSCCHTITPEDLLGESIPIGKPISNSVACVLNAQGQPVPVGVEGELYVGGDGLATGYLGQPALTLERFITHPMAESARVGSRLYRTGDRARYRPDGTLEFLGRLDHQVKIRGFRMELSAIETRLAACAGVKQCVVIPVGTRSEEKKLVAYLVPQKGAKPERDELHAQLAASLPDYMIPSIFIVRESLPLTDNGKVDRRKLGEETPSTERVPSVPEAPRNDLERRMCLLWAEVLGLSAVGIHQNFFELGGHSLLAVRLFERIHREFGCRLPLAALFDHPTVADLVPLLASDEKQSKLWSLIVPIRPQGSRIPFFCIHGGGGEVLFGRDLARHLDPAMPFYGIQARGLHNTHERHHSIEEMAEDYLREIRSIHPQGPLLLGGYCMGGLVAYEMAQRLKDDRIQVRQLILIDSVNATGIGPRPRKDARPKRWLQKLSFQWGNLSLLSYHDRLHYFRQRFGSALSRRTLWAQRSLERWLGPAATGREWSPGDPVLNEHHSAEIIQRYHPRPSRIPTILFRPEFDDERRNDWHMGWKPVLEESLQVVSIPVYPGGMLVEPFIGQLGREINKRV